MHELLTKATHAGIRLELDGDDLRVVGPTYALTPELREALRTHKAALIARLRTMASHARAEALPGTDVFARRMLPAVSAHRCPACVLDGTAQPDGARPSRHALLFRTGWHGPGLPPAQPCLAKPAAMLPKMEAKPASIPSSTAAPQTRR